MKKKSTANAKRDIWWYFHIQNNMAMKRVKNIHYDNCFCVFVCVCLCEREKERDREKDRKTERERERETPRLYLSSTVCLFSEECSFAK